MQHAQDLDVHTLQAQQAALQALQAVALLFGDGSVDFLGTQGDPWDAQSDMLLALIGAVVGLLLLSRMQDRQIKALESDRQ